MADILADDIFKCIFVNENIWISIKIWLKFVPKGRINILYSNIGSNNGLAPTRRQAIIWTNADPIHWHIYAALGGDELTLIIVRRAGLLWSQQDFEWRSSVPLFKCLTVLEFSFILFDLCLLITFFNFIMNYVPIVTFWIFTYHKIWILSIMFCSIWSYWIIYFLAC